MMKGFTRNFSPLEILKEEQVEALWQGILVVLEETGVRFEHPKARQSLQQAGCRVDSGNLRVRFPPGLVRMCLQQCPMSFSLKAREGKNDVALGGNRVYFSSTPGTQQINLEEGTSRVATRKEFEDAVRVYDALDTLHMLHSNSPYNTFEGVHPLMATVETFALRTRFSSKVNRAGPAFGNDRFQIQIAQAVGARPMFGMPASPPLTWGEDACEAAFRVIAAGFPLMIATGDIYGATAPATLSGSVVHNCATIVSAIVLVQVLRPGTPVMPSNFSWPLNMRTGEPAYGNIAVALHDVVFNQVWRSYGLPVGNLGAGIGSSKQMDFQCAYERSMLGLIDALSGANMIWFHGCVNGELTAHPVQAILDDDVAGMIGRFVEGVDVNDVTLALDLIDQVGPIPGFYLDKKHTMEWWKREQFIPRAADQSSIGEWLKKGKKGCVDHARERMEAILSAHRPDPLTPSQEQEIERILEEARTFHRSKM